ncbi:cytoplasmic dynein 1 intermediate chain 1 isoform X5 [Synchiropus splendidus]|uniref:cytoplasmic dynein 1 intermediate chain 1 isoform X5 n=1 Tax=Synchiropus splendidus TaxID=270530 RepID=UPI00237D763C|nr:cytoplasmic dynein 1 intermediate chain 1 isoform X5 [Synchiropus splendidus]
MSDKSDLKAELERKKQRLAQIREEKKRKEEERKKKEVRKKIESQKAEVIPEDSDLDRKRRETEALLQSIGISPEPSLVPTPMSPSKSVSTPSETGSQDSVDGGAAGRSGFSKNKSQPHTVRTLQWDTDPSVLQLHADSELGRKMQKLGASKITQVDFLPKEVVSYSKETQTPLTAHLSEVEEEEADEDMMETMPRPEAALENGDDNEEAKEATLPVLRELTEEERQHALHSAEFQTFFDSSIRVMERALAENSDILFDYSGRDLEDKEGTNRSSLSVSRVFYDEHWSKHRVVTSLDWSPQYPELLVAAYNSNENSHHEPDGVALVWNIKFKKATPEYVFNCQHPVYCVNVVGTQNANNLITVSSDGKMCSWSLDMLSQPQESMELVYNKSKPVAVMSMAFPVGDVNNFVVGSEEGIVYTSSRHGSKVGIFEMFEGHYGPVTGVSCHSAVGTLDFSHLFVTSSFDLTVKLWSTKHNKPLCTFEDNGEYVYDVMWSPVHPAVFAAVDGNGHLDLWNLNNDTEVPTASVVVEGAPALNKVRWSSGAKEVAVGDSEGRVWIYDAGELSAAHSDDWPRFNQTLADIRTNRSDNEEDVPVELPS